MSSRRLVLFIGFFVGLSALEVNVGPVLAIIGAAGFVIAFALQNSLSNFASGDVITNITGSTQRRVDLVFGIGYSDDIDKAQKVLEEIVNGHELVLKEPEVVVKLHELADSSVNFICRPWVKPEDYWNVYWDITREVKRRFDAEGISIPFPQRDVHIYQETAGAT